MTSRVFARLALAAAVISLAFFARPGAPEKAEAQGISVSVEFRQALEPHGRWQRHPRFGEVWIPARVDRDWQPYTRGQWVYTDDWGWYWISSNEEDQWGWVAYHYGRWYRDREVGWVWIPGNEWGPAWVSWRRGGDEVGWAPMPPDDVIVEYEDEPQVWVFVRSRDVIAPSIVRVVLPRQRATVLVRETVVVSRTRYVSGARVAANIGVPPSYLRVAVPVSRVRPVVMRGTARVNNAIEVDAKDAKRPRRAEVQRAERTIQPTKDVPKPERVDNNRTDTPDAPKVLRDAPPASPDVQQKKDDAAPKTQQDKDAPKAEPKQKSEEPKDQPKQKSEELKQKRDDLRKQEKDNDAPKAKQEKRDFDPKAKEQKREERKEQKKNDAERQKREDAPRDEPQQKRELPQKQDASPKGPPQQEMRKEQMAPKEGPKERPKAEPKAEPRAEPKAAPQKQEPAPQAPPQAPQRQEQQRPEPPAKGPGPQKKDD